MSESPGTSRLAVLSSASSDVPVPKPAVPADDQINVTAKDASTVNGEPNHGLNSAMFPIEFPPTSNSTLPSVSISQDSTSDSSSTITSDFINNTRTELPFHDTNLTMAVENSTSEAPIFYNDDSTDTNDTFNPFLAHDYDYYDYNPDVEREPYDYSPVDAEAKREEALALWKNVDVPPAVNYADFTPRDLDPYFLVMPPILCIAFLLLVFVPCFLLKLRDDIRELSGKERKWGSKRYRKQKKIAHESFQVIDPEWQLAPGGKDLSGNALRDVQYVKPGSSGSTYDKTNGPGVMYAKENPAYIEENEVCMQQPRAPQASIRPDPPVDYSEEESASATNEGKADCAAGGINLENGVVVSIDDEQPVDTAERQSSQDMDGKIAATAPMATHPKFTGWNKDLYSSGAGFGPLAKKSSIPNGKPGEEAEDPTWGMY